MKTCIPISVGPPPSEPDDLRALVETDHRRGSIGLHVASDVTRASRTMTSLWLEPERAERLAQEILAAVASWRQHEAAVSWTTVKRPGACSGGGVQ